jgi:ubiquinone/menaquinone biosynthesis C-methylase UbiE
MKGPADSHIVTKEVFARSQDYYDSRGRQNAVGGEPQRYYEWIIKLLDIDASGARFLDVGAGGGPLLACAARAGSLRIFGIDISHECLKIARQNAPSAGLAVSMGEAIPFKEGSFDYIACSGVLEHFFNPQLGIREMKRLLKAGGRIVIMVPNKFQIKDIIKVTRTGYSEAAFQPIEKPMAKNEWRDLFISEGLRLLGIYKYNGFYPFFAKGTFKVKSLKKYLLGLVNRYLVPFNLSYSFVYVCEK